MYSLWPMVPGKRNDASPMKYLFIDAAAEVLKSNRVALYRNAGSHAETGALTDAAQARIDAARRVQQAVQQEIVVELVNQALEGERFCEAAARAFSNRAFSASSPGGTDCAQLSIVHDPRSATASAAITRQSCLRDIGEKSSNPHTDPNSPHDDSTGSPSSAFLTATLNHRSLVRSSPETATL